MMENKIYIIPGYKQNKNTHGYPELKKALELYGFEAILLDITWNYKVMSQYIEDAESQLGETEKSFICGFSFGAMIALKLSQKFSFQKVVLCSLSPYFSEDLPYLPNIYQKTLGTKRWTDFKKNFSEKSIGNLLGNNYILIYGGDERKRLKYRAKKMIDILSIKDVGVVEGVGHRIGDSRYINQIIHLVVK